jgi:hypothetical protein
MNSILQAALNFYDAGISVVPARADGSKAPIGNWKQYQEQRATREQIVQWFSNGGQGLGIVTGFDGVEMLEAEGRAVTNGFFDEARDLALNSGLGELWQILVNGYAEMTPSGGLHFLYRIADEPVPGNTKLAQRPGENDAVECLFETRGSGGFVVTAPSSGTVHPSGQPWVLLKGSPATIPMFSWEEREALHSIFKALDSMPHKEQVAQKLTNNTAPNLDKPGDDFNARADWSDILVGWKISHTDRDGVTYWIRSGKSMGISATTGKNEADNLFVFSTSTPFESEKPYSKFAAYARLHYNDDFSATAKALRAMGYGASSPSPSQSLSSLPSLPQSSTSSPLAPVTDIESLKESSWKPVNLEQLFDGTYVRPQTSMLARTDGNFLLYQGKVHSLYGESESGKSWIAQIAVAEQLRAFKKVIYIDFESDAADVVDRLKTLKVSQAEILQNFRYIKPEAQSDFRDPNWNAILEPHSASLIVIDGVTEALSLWQKESKDNDAITAWMRQFPRTVAASSGAAVVLIDHVTKNAETRGRFAIGGQAKLATIDGAAYLVEPLEVIAPGKTGTLTLRVTKDRPGAVRKIAGLYRKNDRTQEAAVITIDSTKAEIQYVIAPPLMEDQVLANQIEKVDREIVTFIDSNPGATKSMATRGIKGQDSSILARLEILIRDGILENAGNDRGYKLYVTDEGKARFGILSAMILSIGGGS